MVDLGGYVIIICENKDKKVKLYEIEKQDSLLETAKNRQKKFNKTRFIPTFVDIESVSGSRLSQRFPQRVSRKYLENSSSSQLSIKFSDYDLIVFKLDHTIVKYNFNLLVKDQYEFLVGYLTKIKKYPPEYFGNILDSDIDFVCRGTFIDIAKGNFLKVDNICQIIKASNGTKQLTEREILRAYGKKKLFRPVSEFAESNTKNNYKNVFGPKLQCYTEHRQCAGVLVFAKTVDLIKTHKLKKKLNLISFWRDIENGLSAMDKDDSEISNVMPDYAIKSDPRMVAWLAELKKHGPLMLITCCDPTAADQRMKSAFNEKWRELFDFIVYNIDRFLFFRGNSYFCNMDGLQVPVTSRGEYKRGSIDALELQLKTELLRPPRILYAGGGSFHEILAPRCEVIGLIEEIAENPYFVDQVKYALHFDHCLIGRLEFPGWLLSKSWGRLDGEDDILSIWGRVIEGKTKYCAPSLSYFMNHPIYIEYHPHWLDAVDAQHFSRGRSKSKFMHSNMDSIDPFKEEELLRTQKPKDKRKSQVTSDRESSQLNVGKPRTSDATNIAGSTGNKQTENRKGETDNSKEVDSKSKKRW